MPKLRMFPFDEVEKNSRVAIYGSGVIFDEFMSQVRALDYCKIEWVLDKKILDSYDDQRQNLKYCSPEQMDWHLPDHIIIASIEFKQEIENEILRRKGNLDKVISLTDKHIVDLKVDYKSDLEQQRGLIESGSFYVSRTPALIVSLTSMPSRINTLHLVIESLMQQSLKPDAIILWLGHDTLPDGELSLSILPKPLLEQIPRGLEIRACQDIKSYKKLIPALQDFYDDVIVTVDDDILFPSDWLEKLYIAYQKEPDVIHCHQGHYIGVDQKNDLVPYSDWITGDHICGYASSFIFPIGCGGVLYPPRVLHQDVLDIEMAQSLCPTGDDIWFKAMALKNNIKSKILLNRMKSLNYVAGSQERSLCDHNLNKDDHMLSPNDYQIKAVFQHYDLFDSLTS